LHFLLSLAYTAPLKATRRGKGRKFSIPCNLTRRSTIRQFHTLALAFAFAFTAGVSEVRADLLTYNMTGTIQSVGGVGSIPVAVGDQVTWTLQYDSSTSKTLGGSLFSTFSPTSPVITSIVDQTTHTTLFVEPASSLNSAIALTNGVIPFFGNFLASDFHSTSYNATLSLTSNSWLPTLNLASLQLNTVPFNLSSPGSFLFYHHRNYSFTASIDSLSLSDPHISSTTPEPRSLTLFVLGGLILGALSLTGCLSRWWARWV
jgi:hypothetical protein